ncbi:MAG: DUF1566 domain-containing protein [Syntrophobacteraceae bacterium]|nr:DUF1566 domain-containing protein [Syntrophobacteraceae bacterium]
MSHWRAFGTVMVVCMLTCSCGEPKDREGASLKVGKHYVMTREGLELVPFPRDRHGNRLEPGKDYRMVADGLELVTHLRDVRGNRVEIGHDYFMTEDGLRPVRTRLIEGVLVDAAGKALAGMPLALEGTSFRTTSESDGAFRFPFVEGPLTLVLEAPELPGWCRAKTLAEGYPRREDYPDGWELGPVGIPCIATAAGDGRKVWTTPDGRFSDNGDGTVSDLRSQLMWESEVGEAESVERAGEYAGTLNLGGASDWRLPSVDELKALADTGRACVWNGPALIRGGLTAWALDSDQGAAVVNLCSGEARKGSGAETGPGPNPGVLAVRAMRP